MKEFVFAILAFSMISCTKNNSSVGNSKTLLGTDTNTCQQYSQENGFINFAYAFSIDSCFQKSNISFPLPLIINDSNLSFIRKGDWEYRNYRFAVEFMTFLNFGDTIDHKKHFYKDNNESSIIITFFSKEYQRIEKMNFIKRNNSWLLISISFNTLPPQSEKENFFVFITKFANDVDFARQRVSPNATISCLDMDDYSKVITKPFNPNQDIYEDDEYLFREIYFQSFNESCDTIILYVKGFDTGYHSYLHFQRNNGKWHLTNEENLGN